MNTQKYRILEASSPLVLENLVNQLFTENLGCVTILGGMCVEVYPGFPPVYRQSVFIDTEDRQLLMEKLGVHEESTPNPQLITENASMPDPVVIIKDDKKKSKKIK